MTGMEVLASLVRGAGGGCIHCDPGRDERIGDHGADEAIEAPDISIVIVIVIVDGEGMIDHATKRARRLCASGPCCAGRGKRALLNKSTLQDSDAAIDAVISRFDHVWVRESASAARIWPT